MKGIVLSNLLNRKQEEAPKLNPIEFVKGLYANGSFHDRIDTLSEWDFILLIERNYTLDGYDLIWATRDGVGGVLWLGHWNDGVTE